MLPQWDLNPLHHNGPPKNIMLQLLQLLQLVSMNERERVELILRKLATFGAMPSGLTLFLSKHSPNNMVQSILTAVFHLSAAKKYIRGYQHVFAPDRPMYILG
jgi:hypothetical protein